MGKRLTTEIFIERAKRVHGDKYDYSKTEYKGYDDKVEIICLEHGSFIQSPNHHLRGHGCPKCSKRYMNQVYFIEQAKEVHRNKYDYSKVKYIDSRTKVGIICPEHGEFWQTPNNHLRGKGCPRCVGKVFSNVDFINKAQNIHVDKYDYSKVEYINSKTNILIHCNDCGSDFWQTPDNHLQGEGCICCFNKIRGSREIILKGFLTKKQQGLLNSSKLQENLNSLLINYFGEFDVETEYNEDERYPFHCDFYIKSLDLFIELNGHWTHGGRWFEECISENRRMLDDWILKSQTSLFYKKAIDVWTIKDVRKRAFARKNNLNYVVFWDGKCNKNGLTTEIEAWFAEGCPIRQDWK